MREIKFRAWHKGQEKWVEIDKHFSFTPDGELYQTDFKPIELVQYTGLKDKNGKEIYEGDIVKSGTEYNSYTGMDAEIYAGNVYKVVWGFLGFTLSPQSIYSINWKNLKVIGNIYENPELLDKSKGDQP